jgi:putative transposase
VKTVPTVQPADATEAANLLELPEEVRLSLTDVAGAAREGLLAMSVAAGLAVMQAMFEAEISEIAGPRGKHNPQRVAVRYGAGAGSVTLGGRRVPVSRPRARTVDGHEMPLTSYAHFASDDLLSRVVMERMLAGVATRRHARAAEPVGERVAEAATSTSRSAVSRRFVKQTETALAELMTCDLSGQDIKVLLLDGEHVADRCVVVALAITRGRDEAAGRAVGRLDGEHDRGALAAGRPGRTRPAFRGRAAGGHRRRQGAGRRRARGVRRQGPGAEMHPARGGMTPLARRPGRGGQGPIRPARHPILLP